MDYPRTELRDHMLRPNLSLNTMRQTKAETWRHALVANSPSSAIYVEIKDGCNVFPLYLYISSGTSGRQGSLLSVDAEIPASDRVANFDRAFINEIETRSGFSFIPDGTGDLIATVGPEDIFHYIYAVFYAPTYRSRYAELLKTDFPRVPLTRDQELFRTLCAKGNELVALHLMESPTLAKSITRYPIPGSDIVDAGYPRYVAAGEPEPGTGKPLPEDRLYINRGDQRADIRAQYFAGVPQEVWEFHVGGYQVCEKWLKDRRGRKLSSDDLTHYERIVVALAETIRLMAEIDDAIPSWPLE